MAAAAIGHAIVRQPAFLKPDAGDYRQLPLNGNVVGRTVVAVQSENAAVADADALTTYADQTAAIVFMGQAQERGGASAASVWTCLVW